jgi:hypothetical protein
MLPRSTAISTKERRSLTPWELPSLLNPVHAFRRSKSKAKTERPHFPAILGFVYRNRFAVASQIQRRFRNVLRSDRTTRRHLEELESLGYVGVAAGRADFAGADAARPVKTRFAGHLRSSSSSDIDEVCTRRVAR